MEKRSKRSRVAAAAFAAVVVVVGAMGAAQVAAGHEGVPFDPPVLTDAEIAHVAVTANAIDIEVAKLVEGRARSAIVREFAATMIRDHTAVNERAAELAGRLGVTPEPNAVSESLLSGAAEARSRLEPLRGTAFDRAYADREVAYHAAVLEALDAVLIPQTDNAELRALLLEVRPAIAAHLEHARSLRASLATGR